MATQERYEETLDRLRQYRDERDWSQFHGAKDLAIAVSTEAGELLENFLWRADDEVVSRLLPELEGEVADVAIYLLFLCDRLGIDLLEVIDKKLAHNRERHPVPSARGRSRVDS